MIAMHRQHKSSQTKRRALASPCAVLRKSLRLNTLALLLAIAAGSALLAPNVSAAEPPSKTNGKVTVKTEQLHQIEVVVAESRSISPLKSAIGQIAFNEDASTNVLAPFSGRVTRVIARVGDEVKRGAPLFEIDSPEVMQAQTDLIGCGAGRRAIAKSQLGVDASARVVDRLSELLARQSHLGARSRPGEAAILLQAPKSDSQDRRRARLHRRSQQAPRVMVGRTASREIEQDRARPDHRRRFLHGQRRRSAARSSLARSDTGAIRERRIPPNRCSTISDLSTMWLKASVAGELTFRSCARIGQELEVRRARRLKDRVFRARITAIGAASDSATDIGG